MRLRLTLALVALCGTIAVAQRKSMPYKTVDRPEFVPASQAAFVADGDRVIGVMEGKQAKAYPAADLAQHGVVQDRLASGPIAVTW
jgi:septum formation inhibitor-activating ATPase MinD